MMIKKIPVLFILLICLCFSSCSPADTTQPVKNSTEQNIKKKYDGSLRNYVELQDGTYVWNENSYKYRLIIDGKVEQSANYITYTFLSNRENITFEEAHKAAGFSTKESEYFALTEAVCVDMKMEYLID